MHPFASAAPDEDQRRRPNGAYGFLAFVRLEIEEERASAAYVISHQRCR
jgi:hypothetical protein